VREVTGVFTSERSDAGSVHRRKGAPRFSVADYFRGSGPGGVALARMRTPAPTESMRATIDWRDEEVWTTINDTGSLVHKVSFCFDVWIK
jgi:hypothetical protein